MPNRVVKCGSCGQNFECGSQAGFCWCSDLKKVEKLPSEYFDCLCDKCLKAWIKSLEEKSKENKELTR